MSDLTKTTSLVYLLSYKSPRYVGFCEEGVEPSVVGLELSEEAWGEMGCPSTVTVTVELGDTLNEEPA